MRSRAEFAVGAGYGTVNELIRPDRAMQSRALARVSPLPPGEGRARSEAMCSGEGMENDRVALEPSPDRSADASRSCPRPEGEGVLGPFTCRSLALQPYRGKPFRTSPPMPYSLPDR